MEYPKTIQDPELVNRILSVGMALILDKLEDDRREIDRLKEDHSELTSSLSDTLRYANGYWRQLRELRDLCAQHHSAIAVEDVMAVIGCKGADE